MTFFYTWKNQSVVSLARLKWKKVNEFFFNNPGLIAWMSWPSIALSTRFGTSVGLTLLIMVKQLALYRDKNNEKWHGKRSFSWISRLHLVLRRTFISRFQLPWLNWQIYKRQLWSLVLLIRNDYSLYIKLWNQLNKSNDTLNCTYAEMITLLSATAPGFIANLLVRQWSTNELKVKLKPTKNIRWIIKELGYT